MAAELHAVQRRFPGAILLDGSWRVSVTLTDPSLEGALLAASPLSAVYAANGEPTVEPSPALPPKVASALSLLWRAWAGAQFEVPGPLPALRWLESHGGEALRSVIALQGEMHGASGSTTLAPSAADVPPAHPQALWTPSEHAAFEAAVHREFHASGRRLDDASAWAAVASDVGMRRVVTADACAQRFLLLASIVREWTGGQLQQQVPPPRGGSALISKPPSHELQKKTATSSARRVGSSAAADTLALLEGAPCAEDTLALLEGSTVPAARSAPAPPCAAAVPVAVPSTAAVVEEEEGEESDLVEGEGEDEEAEDLEGREEHGISHPDLLVPVYSNVFLTPPSSLARGAWALSIDRLSLQGVGALAASRVSVGAHCVRCDALVPMSLAGATQGGASAAAAAAASAAALSGAPPPSTAVTQQSWCPCSQLVSLSFYPTLIHEGSPSLGFIEAAHATITSVASASLLVSCLECGVVCSITRFAPPCVWEAACRTCHGRMRIEARDALPLAYGEGAAGAEALAAAAAAGVAAVAAARGGPRARLTIGRPLPAQGTCGHYKRSRRWLLFPCCDSYAPCDVCHDTREDHPHEWARRMVCGLCSREQPFSNSPCVACGSDLTRTSSGDAHWEGGAGQRNRALMGRRESRKHTGIGKTVSAKATRVGSEASRAAAMAAGGGGGAARTFERYHHGALEKVEVRGKTHRVVASGPGW